MELFTHYLTTHTDIYYSNIPRHAFFILDGKTTNNTAAYRVALRSICCPPLPPAPPVANQSEYHTLDCHDFRSTCWTPHVLCFESPLLVLFFSPWKRRVTPRQQDKLGQSLWCRNYQSVSIGCMRCICFPTSWYPLVCLTHLKYSYGVLGER